MTAAPWEAGSGWATVSVASDADGLVVVVPVSADDTSDLHGARIDAVGGTIVVDTTRPDSPPRAVLGDSTLAQDWLSDVYGEAVADLVDEVGRGGPGGEVEALHGPLALAIVQLGVGIWLHRWWPAETADRPGLDERLLEIELGSLAWQAESCYGSADPAARLLTPHPLLLADLWQAVQGSATGAAAEALAERLARALAATADVVSPTVEGWSRCSEHLAAFTARQRVETAERLSADMWEALERSLGSELASSPGGGTRYRSRATVVRWGRGTVDVRQVPPRVVSGDPDNVAWRVRDREGLHHVEVTVTTAFGVTSLGDPGLCASVSVAGVPTILPLAPDGAVLRSETALVLPVEPDDEVTVEVFHPDYASVLRRSPEGRVDAEADRTEIGRVLDDRLAHPGALSLQAEHEALRRGRR